jgi:hypothetical protein
MKGSRVSDLTRRQFGLSDSLILIAATAFGLAPLSITASQLTLARFALPSRTAADAWGPINSLAPYAIWATIHATPLLTSWSLAALALTLRSPRPPLRRLARRPGFAVALAVLVASVVTGLNMLAQGLNGRFGMVDILYFAQSDAMVVEVGWMTVGAWLWAAIGGRWRPGATWTDRLGCTLGVAWLVLFLMYWVRILSSQFGWM